MEPQEFQLKTYEEIDAVDNSKETVNPDFDFIALVIKGILRGKRSLLPTYLSTVPLTSTRSIDAFILRLCDIRDFEFNSRIITGFEFNSDNIHDIIVSIQDADNYYELDHDIKEDLKRHFFQYFLHTPLNTQAIIDELAVAINETGEIENFLTINVASRSDDEKRAIIRILDALLVQNPSNREQIDEFKRRSRLGGFRKVMKKTKRNLKRKNTLKK
jgi:hypothetical protein